MSLGQDFSADAMNAFGGELYVGTLTRNAETAYDVNDPTGPSTGAPTVYPCEGIGFRYAFRDIDGTRVVKGDYRIVLLRGSLPVIPADGDLLNIPPPGETVARVGRVVRVDTVTEAYITLQVRG